MTAFQNRIREYAVALASLAEFEMLGLEWKVAAWHGRWPALVACGERRKVNGHILVEGKFGFNAEGVFEDGAFREFNYLLGQALKAAACLGGVMIQIHQEQCEGKLAIAPVILTSKIARAEALAAILPHDDLVRLAQQREVSA